MRKPSQFNKRGNFPLLTAGQLFQICAVGQFDQLRQVNRQIQATEAELDAAGSAFYACLPAGYSRHPYAGGTEMFYVLDGHGNDVGFPLTDAEAHALAWSHAGEDCPLAPAYLSVARKLHALREEAAAISRVLDETAIKTKAEFAAA